MKKGFIIIFILAGVISNISASYWSSGVGTNSSSWYIYRQSQTLNFDLSGSVEGQVLAIAYHDRNMGPYSSYYANIKENDVEYRERMSTLEGDYVANEDLKLRSNTSNDEIDIAVTKSPGSGMYSVIYNESWPVYLGVVREIDYSGKQINDRDFEGNNRDFVETNLLYNKALKKSSKTSMWIDNMTAIVLPTENTIESANFLPNKHLDYELSLNTTGIADLRYWQSSPLYDTKRQTYFAAGESRETYFGTYNISRKVQMGLRYKNFTFGDELILCCLSGSSSDQNGNETENTSDYSSYHPKTNINAEYWFNKGLALLKLGNYSEAVAAYEKATEIANSNATAWSQKGVALALMGKNNESIESFNKAIEIDPKYATPYYNKGKLLEKLGRYEEAIETDEKVIELNPKFSLAWYNKGRSLASLGRNAEAIKVYDNAIDLDPQQPLFWFAKGSALKSLNRTGEANLAFGKAQSIAQAIDNSA